MGERKGTREYEGYEGDGVKSRKSERWRQDERKRERERERERERDEERSRVRATGKHGSVHDG